MVIVQPVVLFQTQQELHLSELKTLKGNETGQIKKYRAITKYTRNLTKLAKDNKLPIVVCDMFKAGNLLDIINGNMKNCSIVK